MNNYKNFAHKISQRMSEQAFNPTTEEKAIFHALTNGGPKILTKLGKIIENYGEWKTNRWTIKRRIYGPKNAPGLIKYEYIKEKEHESRIPGNDGKYFCLTIKGLLASLVNTQLEDTYLFKKYMEFITNKLEQDHRSISQLDKDVKDHLIDTIAQYIKNNLLLFLIWHDAHGLNLKKKTDMNWYFVDFFKNADENIFQKFHQNQDKNLELEYKIVLEEYFVSLKILTDLEKSIKKLKSKNMDSINSLQFYFKMISPFVFEWYRYFDRLQLVSPINKPYNIRAVPGFVINDPRMGISIGPMDYSGMLIHDRIKVKISKITQRPIRHRISNYDKGTTIHRHKN